jgi:hypothetical protein
MRNVVGLLSLCAVIAAATALAPAQTTGNAPAQTTGNAPAVAYEKPLRGAPARRVTGASRGTKLSQAIIPTIELLAPDGHTGETISPSPTLYYFVSAPVPAPVRFTISADRQVTPVLEVDIPSPKAAGVYGLPLADFGVKLEPGVGYVWSVSATLSAEEPSDDIVASAALLRTVPDPAIERALRDASTSQRVVLLARAGLWYDAVAAAADIEAFDQHAALDALMNEVGLVEAARYDRQATSGDRSR